MGLQTVYNQYLANFDNAYLNNMTKGAAAPNMPFPGPSNQGGPSGLQGIVPPQQARATPTGGMSGTLPSTSELGQLVQFAKMSAEELRTRHMPQELINKIEVNRALLMRMSEGQQTQQMFRENIQRGINLRAQNAPNGMLPNNALQVAMNGAQGNFLHNAALGVQERLANGAQYPGAPPGWPSLAQQMFNHELRRPTAELQQRAMSILASVRDEVKGSLCTWLL